MILIIHTSHYHFKEHKTRNIITLLNADYSYVDVNFFVNRSPSLI